jgi:hypothetical protein
MTKPNRMIKTVPWNKERGKMMAMMALGTLLMVSHAFAQEQANSDAEAAATAGGEVAAPDAQEDKATGQADGEKAEPAASDTAGSSEAAPEAEAATPESADDAEKAMREMQEADATYRAKIRGLEEKVNELKESIFRSKAKLMMLTEQVTGGLSTSAKLLLLHENQMGTGFALVQRHFFLDGMPLHQDADETGERFKDEGEIIIFDGPIIEGTHTLTVSLVYRGEGTGLFSYLDGYAFHLKDSFTFTTEQGKITTNKVVGFEKGDFTTSYLERPAIRLDSEIIDDRVEDDLEQGVVVP